MFRTKKDCCGCTACMSICPKQAITMEPDEDEFIYPTINTDLCMECGLCVKTCVFQSVSETAIEPLATYAAINRNQSIVAASASGGIFAALALIIFKKNGVVFGCAFNNDMEPEHSCVDNPTTMKKLQGSKYVQSSINSTFAEAKQYLEQGIAVLYTGTPCQLAGLKSYLGKVYQNLITADIICHGVPSAGFFKGYIKHLEGKLKGKVVDFKFRDKSKGLGYMGKAVYEKNGAVREEFIPAVTSYYYSYFLKGDIFRENCYECKYASGSRQGDFTMGDYWGREKAHPEIDTRNGVSVLLVNSAKGMALIEELGKYLNLTQSTFEQAREQNVQLRQPTAKSYKREAILKTWREGGYQAVAYGFYQSNKKQLAVFRIKMLMPQPVKKLIKKRMLKLEKALNKIKVAIRNLTINKANRKELTNKDFSLLSSNCNGAFILHDLKLGFKSPTVNLFISANDYIKFLEGLDYYLNCDLVEVVDEKYNYPLGALDEIIIHFMHYNNFEEARNIWGLRLERFNKENLFIMMTDRDGCTDEIIRRFQNLSYKHKVIFTHKPYPEIKSAVYIKGFENKLQVGDLFKFKSYLAINKYYDAFDYVKWFNTGDF